MTLFGTLAFQIGPVLGTRTPGLIKNLYAEAGENMLLGSHLHLMVSLEVDSTETNITGRSSLRSYKKNDKLLWSHTWPFGKSASIVDAQRDPSLESILQIHFNNKLCFES